MGIIRLPYVIYHGLKPISQTRTGSYFLASDASSCQGSYVTKTGMNILVFNSY